MLANVQRSLKVGGRQVTDANLHEVWGEIAAHFPGKLPPPYLNQARDLFEDWVGSWGPMALGKLRLSSGVDRQYPDVKSVARALLGEVKAAANLEAETEQAKRLYRDPRSWSTSGCS